MSKASRCERCKRRVWLDSEHGSALEFDKSKYALPAADYGQSHFFCDDCLTELELGQARQLGELEDKSNA